MKKKLFTALLTLVSSASSYAIDWNSQSLVGLEVGYGNMNVKGQNYNQTINPLTAGIKIGAKNKNARMFLSVRYLNIPDFDLSLAYGGELQYLMPMSQTFDLFVGANAGMITMSFDPSKFDAAATSNTRNVMNYYAGLDAGLNLNISESFAFELGARYMYLDISHTKSFETYEIGSLIQAYMSFIYKYHTSN